MDAVLDHLSLTENQVFADLGCGEGNVLIRAAERFNVFCVGFEIDYRLLPEAKKNVKQAGLSGRVDIVYVDLFRIDLSRFDVLYVYPFPTIAEKLSRKMQKECRKGAVVLSHEYSLPTLKLCETICIPIDSTHLHKVHIYRF